MNNQNEVIDLNSQIKKIANLCVLEVYYNTVVDIEKDKGKGFFSFIKSERRMWIQLLNRIKVGLDISKLKLSTIGNKIVYHLPAAKIIGNPIAEIDKIKIIVSKDGTIFKNQITPKERSKSIAEANEELKLKVSKDTLVLNYARQRAKIMIENFIKIYMNLVLGKLEEQYTLECIEE